MKLEQLEQEAWTIKKKYYTIIEPYRSDLWRYCKFLTGSSWDAEDLVQETLLRSFAMLAQVWQPLNPKSYLFKIATNTWINQNRKKLDNQEIHEDSIAMENEKSYLAIEAIEHLVHYLPPRQVVAILLIDVFQFTALETASLINTTEGAVKAILNRGRVKLRTISKQKEMNLKPNTTEKFNRSIMNAFLEAFNNRDPEAIASLLNENAVADIVHVAREYGKETISKHSLMDLYKDPTINNQRAIITELWDRPVIAICHNSNGVFELNDIYSFKVEENKIVEWRSYYFCKDLLSQAALELKISVHEKTYMMEV